MKHSDSITALAAALVKAQAEMPSIAKDATNPAFRSKFASLDGIVSTVRPVLAKHGLALVQGGAMPHTDENSAVKAFHVETMLVHTSGEWLSNAVLIPLGKQDPQGAGSALTYGRRYSLAALLSLATDEDDDANSAQPSNARPRNAAAPSRSTTSAKSSASRSSNPADTPMPFGKTKDKRLGDHTTEELRKTAAWCVEKQKFADLVVDIEAVLAERGEVTVPADDPHGNDWRAALPNN